MTGEDVSRWQAFLVGQRFQSGEADGSFGPMTRDATMVFQRRNLLTPDGTVGTQTAAKAMSLGFDPLVDDDMSETGPNWPPPPDNLRQLVTNADREATFGKFAYRSAPVAGSPEAILITDSWARNNISQVSIPQLRGIQGAPGSASVPFHKNGAAQLVALWAAWEAAGLLPLVLSWAGSWVPRFVRGSTTVLSNHAFGTAFDINPLQNGLGAKPALVGERGSVRKLVPIANSCGFWWGGHYGSSTPGVVRTDGMHFELAASK